MKEISQYLFIAKLICKERIAGLNDSEKKRLDSWRNESGKRERVFLDLQRISTEELEKRYDKVDVDLKWESFKKRQQFVSEKLTNSNLRKADSLQAAVVADYHPALRHSS